jgi:hypothetical protein
MSVGKKKKVRKKMRRGGGAAKGGQFERDRCVQFSLWWTEGKRDDICWRTSGSGSRATSRRRRSGKSTFNEFGDMKYIDPIGKSFLDTFCFEFKSYKTYDMLGVLQSVDPNRDWMKFWAKCYDDALSVPRRPFLVTKRNHGLLLGWVTTAVMMEFDMLGYRPKPSMILRIDERIVEVKSHKISLPEHSVVGFRLEQFLECVDPRVLEGFYGGRGEYCEAQCDGTGAPEGDSGEEGASSSGSESETPAADGQRAQPDEARGSDAVWP